MATSLALQAPGLPQIPVLLWWSRRCSPGYVSQQARESKRLASSQPSTTHIILRNKGAMGSRGAVVYVSSDFWKSLRMQLILSTFGSLPQAGQLV